MIGLKRGIVKLVAHHDEWQKEFVKEKQALLKALSGFDVTIEHVGSTAIPEVVAKPIIDMMLGIHDIADQKNIYKILESIGYIDRGDGGIPEQNLFVRGPEDCRTHYLHVTKLKSNYWTEHIVFRDYLRKNKKAREEYNELKKNLAKKYSNKREFYTKLKTPFIQEVLKVAIKSKRHAHT